MLRSSRLQSSLFQAGKELEVEVLGRCGNPYAGNFADVRKHQPSKKTDMVVAIEREFARRGLSVQFYTAVGTALDVHQGVDGFFEFNGVVVTIDLTMNPEKVIAKADFVVQKSDLENIPQLAGWIAQRFIQKLEVKR